MKLTKQDLAVKIQDFAHYYSDMYRKAYGHLPTVEIDAQWPSPCLVEAFDDEKETWQPVKIEESLAFENIEQALSLDIHEDIKTYFTCVYSDSVYAECSEGKLSLLFPWSKEDFARLQENIIGHILMKRKLKQAITIFFAVTDQEDLILSINNETGEVWVERVGCEPHKKLSDSLAEFIETLVPFTALAEF